MVGVNRKILAAGAMALGLLFITLGLYQTNQYMVSSATAAATLKSFGQLGAEAGSYTAQLTASMAEVSGALAQAIFLDYALGAVLVLLGLFVYPEK